MRQIPYVFNQLCQYLDRDYFEYLVKKYGGNKYVKSFTCWNHLLVMLWAQLTSRASLRDIEMSLLAHSDKLYRLGLGKSVARSTLAEANSKRDVAIYREMAHRMMERASSSVRTCKSELRRIFDGTQVAGFFAIDSSTVHLDLGRFPWSVPQRNGGGIKLHTLYDIFKQIPAMCLVTGNEERDQFFMEYYRYREGCLYVFDKAYIKTCALAKINGCGAWFVARPRKRMRLNEVYSREPIVGRGIMSDKVVVFGNSVAKAAYSVPLRMVDYYCSEKNELLRFITNNMELDAGTVAEAYKKRWEIELFFKWIKQHLRIEDFFGTSANAVSIQIYTAITAFCIIAMAADNHCRGFSTYEAARILSTCLTEKKWIQDLLAHAHEYDKQTLKWPSLFDGMLITK